MKNGEILTLYETLKRLTENKELKFNVMAGYILAKDKEILRQEAAIIYKMRQDIIMEHGKFEGKDIIVPTEYIDEVNQKINELMNIENNIKLKELPVDLIENLNLNLEDIEGLSILIQPFIISNLPE